MILYKKIIREIKQDWDILNIIIKYNLKTQYIDNQSILYNLECPRCMDSHFK